MKRSSEHGGILSAFGTFLLVLLVVGLSGVVVYLLSERNHNRFRVQIAVEGDAFVIEKGRKLPIGFEPYVPEDESLQQAYLPVKLNDSESLDAPEVFEDRQQLDQWLFHYFYEGALAVIAEPNPDDLKRAEHYIARCRLLPGLSDAQRDTLKRVRADVMVVDAIAQVEGIEDRLARATKNLEDAIRLGTSRGADAQRWLQKLRERRLAYQRMRTEQGQLREETPKAPALVPPKGDDTQEEWKL